MSFSEGFLTTRSGRRMSRKPFNQPDTFPFLKLPGEMRNMIYRLALGQGAVHMCGCCAHPIGFIGVENMMPDEYETYLASHRPPRARTSYKPTMFPAACCPEHSLALSKKTTYQLASSMRLYGLGLLRINKQIRSEVLPIFYGENKWSFRTTSAVRPFIMDRPNVVRQNIQSVELFLDLAYADRKHKARQREWIKVFQYLQYYTNLKKLHITVSDMTLQFLEPATFVGWQKDWLRALGQIKDLDQFSLVWEFSGRELYLDTLMEDIMLDEEDLEVEMDMLDDWMAETEFEYEAYLRSRMLKKRQSSLDAWLKRHVCGPRCAQIRNGRAAAKPGLPLSTSHGEWTLPEVDPDDLYDSTDIDNWSVEEYSESEDSGDEDDDAEQKNDADAKTVENIPGVRFCMDREPSVEL